MADNNLTRLTEAALENIKKLTDVNTIIGEPMSISGGSTVIPVSKISMGFTSGGIDYISKNGTDKAPNFGGGTGSGFTIVPIAFLVIDEAGVVKLLSVENAGTNKDTFETISGLVDKAPTFIEKIVKIFKKDKSDTPKDSAEKPLNSAVVLNNSDIDEMKSE